MLLKNSEMFNEQAICSIGNIFIATYFHTKPLLEALKIQKAIPIIKTSERRLYSSQSETVAVKNSSELTNAIIHCIRLSWGHETSKVFVLA